MSKKDISFSPFNIFQDIIILATGCTNKQPDCRKYITKERQTIRTPDEKGEKPHINPMRKLVRRGQCLNG